MPNASKGLGAGRLLAGDAMMASLLLNEVRHAVVSRVFGASRRDSNIVTVFAVGTSAAAFVAGAARLRRIRVRPTVEEAGIGAIVLKETAHGVAGDWSRGTPLFAALIVLVVLEKSFGPALRGAFLVTRGFLRRVAGTLRRVRALLEGLGP